MPKRTVLFFAALLLIFGVYGIFFADKIPVNDGRGWDGCLYVDYIKRWPDPLIQQELTAYYLKKTFLPALMHYALYPYSLLTGISTADMEISTVLHCFDVLNFIFLSLALILIWKTLEKIFAEKIHTQPWWIMIWVVANFFILKNTFYYPALLDPFAFMLGALMLYGHVSQKTYLILLTMVMGYFTHPLLFIMGALLLIWPAQIEIRVRFDRIWVISILVLCGALCAYGLYKANLHPPGWVRPAEASLLWLSAACTIGYILYILYTSELLATGINYLFSIHWKNLLLIILLYIPLTFVVRQYSLPVPTEITDFLTVAGYDSMQDPLIFIVAHVVYYGPGILVILLFTSSWKPWLKTQSGGLQLLIWFMLLLMFNNESRQLAVFWPFALLLIVTVVSEWKQYYLRWSVALVLLIWSRVWLNMHSADMNDKFYEFPMQYYFMHQGPWMSVENYYWQAAVTLIFGLCLFFYKKYFIEPVSLQRSLYEQ